MYACSRNNQIVIGAGLAGLMLATRFHHFGDALHLPDASWAIFFLAGFYLPTSWLVGLMTLAVGIDLAAIQWGGVTGYCLTPAYAFMLVAYAVLWTGGRWLAAHYRLDGRGAVNFVLAVVASVSLAFVLTNASFYWLGGRVNDLTLAAFSEQFLRYLPMYLEVAVMYLAAAAALHVLATLFVPRQYRA